MTLKKVVVLPLLIVAAVTTVFATPILLAPGASVTAFTPTVAAFSGSLVATYSMTFSNANENGTVFEDVYRNGGVLDFYYQVINNVTSTDSLSRVTVGNFSGFDTSVDYLLIGGDAPTSATRQNSGDSVGFFDTIAPGTASNWLEVATNATTYNSDGTIALIDSVATNFDNTPGPATSVPEPVSLSLLGGELLIGAGLASRSQKNG